jgi:hypothetical protein
VWDTRIAQLLRAYEPLFDRTPGAIDSASVVARQ